MLKRCDDCKRMFLLQDGIPAAGRKVEHRDCSGMTEESAEEEGEKK